MVDNAANVPDWYLSAVTAFFFLSLAVNALVTALIVYRIITVYNDIRGFNTNFQASAPGSGQRNLLPVISILIESGMITFIAQLAQSIMYKFSNEIFPLIGGGVVVCYVRDSCRLLIWYINDTYFFAGNYDGRYPCAGRDGRFLRT